MGAGLGNAAPFLLGAAGSGASGLITGQRQADEHAQLMQMLAMQQAREGREQGLYPGQLAQQEANTKVAQSEAAMAPYREQHLKAETESALAQNEPAPELGHMLSAISGQPLPDDLLSTALRRDYPMIANALHTSETDRRLKSYQSAILAQHNPEAAQDRAQIQEAFKGVMKYSDPDFLKLDPRIGINGNLTPEGVKARDAQLNSYLKLKELYNHKWGHDAEDVPGFADALASVNDKGDVSSVKVEAPAPSQPQAPTQSVQLPMVDPNVAYGPKNQARIKRGDAPLPPFNL